MQQLWCFIMYGIAVLWAILTNQQTNSMVDPADITATHNERVMSKVAYLVARRIHGPKTANPAPKYHFANRKGLSSVHTTSVP